jgi:hypothetical protein
MLEWPPVSLNNHLLVDLMHKYDIQNQFILTVTNMKLRLHLTLVNFINILTSDDLIYSTGKRY